MKIVYCIPSTYNSGGMERVLSQKANYLADSLDWDITIITTSQKKRQPFYRLSEKIRLFDLDIDYESMMSMPIYKRIPARISAKKQHRKKLVDALNKIKPDITVSMFTHEMSFLPDIKDGSKKVLELHFSKNFRTLDSKSNNRSRTIRLINSILDYSDRKSIALYDQFVVLSHRDAQEWGKRNNMSVISNPTAFDVEYPCKENSHRVLSVGRHCAQKGFDMLIDIWNALPVEYKKKWHLDIVGNGTDKELIEIKIKDKNLSDSVSLIAHTPNIKDEYASHDIFCFTSRYEGFGLALMEAMSFGIPPVSFDCPCGPSELIVDGENGYLIPESNLDMFTKKLIELMNDRDKRISMGMKASQYIKDNFSEKVIMDKWVKLFESLL